MILICGDDLSSENNKIFGQVEGENKIRMPVIFKYGRQIFVT